MIPDIAIGVFLSSVEQKVYMITNTLYIYLFMIINIFIIPISVNNVSNDDIDKLYFGINYIFTHTNILSKQFNDFIITIINPNL